MLSNSYIMTKDKNKDDLYYWYCEIRKHCYSGGYDYTNLINGQHNLRNTKEHNHSSDATRKDIITAVHNLKRKAYETNDTPTQIIQVGTNAISILSQPLLPDNHALRQIIKKVCRKDISI